MESNESPKRSKVKKVLDKRRLDCSQIFLIYVATIGDCEATARALDLDPEIVAALAREENWALKLQKACPTMDPAREPLIVNRALNFIQAHRLRCLLERTIQAFDGLTPEQIVARLETTAKNGKRVISGRFFADLAASLEKCHHMSYASLGDTPAERKTANEGEEAPINAQALHSAVIRALSESVSPVPGEVLVKQLAAEIEAKPESTTEVVVERNQTETPPPPDVAT